MKTNSFHPKHVFASVAYSQLKRVSKRNSTKENKLKDLAELREDLVRCGHDDENLAKLTKDLLEATSDNTIQAPKECKPIITLVTSYFQEIHELKKLLGELKNDINTLTGEETDVLVAARKGQSIANKVVKNSKLCETLSPSANITQNQACGSKACKTCPLMDKEKKPFNVNGKVVNAPKGLNCKSDNVIYLAQCKLCDSDNTYCGQTMQRLHQRVNGHRSHFDLNNPESIELSALSLHAYNKHLDNFDINNFKFMVYKQVKPQSLNRQESMTIGSLRTNVLGLNRMNIQKN